ncbi:hypothetical protein BH18ACT15_BH18ACT15_13870 [soil metagenome]
MLWSFVFIAVALAVFELVVVRFGADSRDGDDWLVHRSSQER